MFRISAIQNIEEQKAVAVQCLAEYKEGYFAYVMRDCDTGELMGFSQFEITGEYGYISDLKPRANYDDTEAMFILGRATMNFIDTCGAHKCYADRNGADIKLLHAIGFRDEGDKLFSDMSGMFSGHCG